MDDRKPGSKVAPEPSAMGANGSLSQSLDGALRRAKPKGSLSRHLVGYRVAASDEDVADAIDPAADDPDARLAMARAAQSGEAAWAHERISLIARALDDEASRLAADPQKAGKVAEHLAPLIERAFAGADAEAPGDYARAIIGREREPLETELLTERAVMSVAATQRAERSGRSAALADELARLKEQPQRWAAAHARQGRAIDDLPIDDGRKNAFKDAAARAQANAAAEGLLQQDAGWLLEDLDDPEFANALGRDDAARWRSAAEEAVARRAERIAAESAEHALLAASDMRATLKRLKDKDDGPLPARAEIVAALGETAAADVLSTTLKGRKHRNAIGAAALLAPADENAWLEAAPDKETRTIRELAVATKRAAVAGNPGRWLMQHSVTLKELATEAADDPTKLPRLVEQYAALRNQVRGRSGDTAARPNEATHSDSESVSPGSEVTDVNATPLPDDVAADLVERVLAGETPQARLDALTTILEGAADGGSSDADDRVRADAIAGQLEALGLPQGTRTRWAQLTDPNTRRSARLALLGGFARQIAEEGTILSGEGEEPEIIGDEGDDTLTLENVREGIRIPRGAGQATDSMLNHAVRERVRALVESGAISEEEANEFLVDEGLKIFTEIELDEETAKQLYSADNNEVVAALTEIADVVLLGAEKLAELEEKYGVLAEIALRGAQWIVGGPIKAAIQFIVDRGIDLVMEEVGDDIFDSFIDFTGEQITKFGVAKEDAEKIAAASAFALLAGTGIASGAVDTFGFARHIVRRFVNKIRWTINRPSFADEPFYKDRPETRDRMETMRSMHGFENYTTTLTGFLDGRAFRSFSPQQRDAVNAMFSRTVLPRTFEKHIYDIFAPLMEREHFKIAEQFVISLRSVGEHSVRPDLVFLANGIDAASVKRLTPFLKSVANGFAAIVEAKGPLVDLSKMQKLIRGKMDEIGRADSFSALDIPISEYPPAAIRQMVDVVLKQRPDVPPKIAYLLVDELQKHFHPKLPVWQLLAATSGMLGLVNALGPDHNGVTPAAASRSWQKGS